MVEIRATYRLQLGPDLDFAGAGRLLGYLSALGISHLYLSPCLQARAGSTHGYDVVDPGRVSDALGGEAGLRALADAARAAGMGLILDIVPNHMATDEANPYWSDPELRARFFDLDPVTGRHRRFFDIDHLAGVRQEDPEVFEATHAKVLELAADGAIDGVRVDHPDGLADPRGYLDRLRARGVRAVWVEKILHPGEPLRAWPVCGTTGYDFANDATALFVDPAGERALGELWREVSGDARPFAEVALEAKLEQARTTFTPEVARLARCGPFGTDELERALSAFPVYRAYAEPVSGRVEDADRAAVAEAGIEGDLAAALVLATEAPAELVTRFQQTSPQTMAKGVEDTAFYRHLRLTALNEVGGDPGRFSLSVDDFHAANARRAAGFPRSLLCSQTHDTKRSGDTRARIAALAGMASEWAAHVADWRRLCGPLRRGDAPDAAEEYLIYQTLVGAWPISPARLRTYLVKALREAKRTTSWVAPDEAWEADVCAFADSLLRYRPFLESFEPFLARVVRAGERSALGQLALKLTCPGVPDTYQGDELWCLALVDPDNRRPVDFERRRAALEELRAGAAPTRETIKLHLMWKVLGLRRRCPPAFGDAGRYTPIGAGAACCAYLRGTDHAPAQVLVAVPVRAGGEDAMLDVPDVAAGRWRDVLSGAEHELAPGRVTLDGLLREPYALAVLEHVRAPRPA